MKKLLLALFMAAALCMSPWRAAAQLPGDAVVTCGAQNVGDPVLAIVQAHLVNIVTAPINKDWTAVNLFHAPSWTASNLGQVFGIAIDKYYNIYVTASACYQTDYWTGSGSGAVYKIAAGTGVISVFGPTLPNDPVTHPGLGNICYDPDHNLPNGQFFITNLEDGKIYRKDAVTGANLGTPYDPQGYAGFAADGGSAGVAPLGERLWGIGYLRNGNGNGVARVYFGRWREDEGTPGSSASIANEVHSIALNAVTGDFVAGTGQLEITLPALLTNSWSNPPSDIEFSSTGLMMVAERSMYNYTSPGAHNSRILEYRYAGSWTPTGPPNTFQVGAFYNSTNSAGGTDYGYGSFDLKAQKTVDCDTRVWVTGDALHYPYAGPPGTYYPGTLYGIQVLPATGGSVLNSQLIDLDHDTTNVPKTWIGDVDVIKNCSSANPCSQIGRSLKQDFSAGPNTCCWDLTLINNFQANFWQQIRLDVITAGTVITNVSAPGTWTVSNTFFTAIYTPPSPGLPLGNSGPLKFCISSNTTTQQIKLTWIGKNGEICVDTLTFQCKEPVPPPCGLLTNLKVDCKEIGPNGPVYSMSFGIKNNSTYTVTNAGVTATGPGMVSIAPPVLTFVPVVPPGGTSNTQTLTVYNAHAGDKICFQFSIHDQNKTNCCTFDTCIIMPKCKDCCDSLHLKLAAPKIITNSNGTLSFSQTVTSNPTMLRSFTATIVSATQSIRCPSSYTPPQLIGMAILSGSFPITPAPTTFGTSSVTWGINPGGVAISSSPLNMVIKVPPMPSFKCRDTLRFCIKYTYTDTACRTCDTTVCFQQVRVGSIIFVNDVSIDPVRIPFGPGKDDEGGSGKTEGHNRSTQGGEIGETKALQISMTSEADGTLTIDNPIPESGDLTDGAISIIGMSIEPAVGADLLAVTDNVTGQGTEIVDRVATFQQFVREIPAGETRTFRLTYNNYEHLLAFVNYVKIRYVTLEDRENVGEAVIPVYARTPQGMGGAQLAVDPDIVLANVRTYGFKFTAENSTSDKVCRVVISVKEDDNDGDDIVAVGPGIDRTSVEMQSYETMEADPRKLVLPAIPNPCLAVAVPLDPKDIITPIYVTTCGGEDQTTVFTYTTYTPEGDVISTGTVTADNPFAPGRLGVDDPSRPGIINSVECLPNPLTNSATFNFTLSRAETSVWLTITDMNGNTVASVLSGVPLASGTHQMNFDASSLPNGVYLYTLRTGTQTQTRKLTIVR